eukprot:1822553-Prymnesium_polylepis.1
MRAVRTCCARANRAGSTSARRRASCTSRPKSRAPLSRCTPSAMWRPASCSPSRTSARISPHPRGASCCRRSTASCAAARAARCCQSTCVPSAARRAARARALRRAPLRAAASWGATSAVRSWSWTRRRGRAWSKRRRATS